MCARLPGTPLWAIAVSTAQGPSLRFRQTNATGEPVAYITLVEYLLDLGSPCLLRQRVLELVSFGGELVYRHRLGPH